MLEFIVKYWLQFLFGIVAAGATTAARFFYKMYKEEKARQTADGRAAISKEITEAISTAVHEVRFNSNSEDEKLQGEINSIKAQLSILRHAILVLYKKPFKEACENALKKDHEITLMEYQELAHEHDVYKSLDGNSDGDTLYHLVEQKYQNSL